MIGNRTGKDPVPTTSPLPSASHRSPSALFASRLLHHPARHLCGLARLLRQRRTLSIALLAGSAAAATGVATVQGLHSSATLPFGSILPFSSIAPLAKARPVAPAAEALKTQAALTPPVKHHRIADALQLARLQPLQHLRPLEQHLASLHPLRGLASWYGSVLHGHKTASGETFDETRLTAAHRTLPLGTVVRVTDLRTLRSVIVRINDRGTLAPGRVIDLSSGAAEALGILRTGTAQVRLEVLHDADPT